MLSSTMKNPTSKLLSPLLLGFVALIPNHTFCYTALALSLALAIVCSIHLKSPRAQLAHLAVFIDQLEEDIRRAMVHVPRSYSSLAEQMRRLHEVAKKASSIKCRILNSESESFSWNRLRVLSSDIGECTKDAKNISTAVELILEAERQRKLAYDIMEIQFALTAA
ncbi:hypothetical protein B0H14DRAFT_2771721 [Mycena olivaceomarginata]|nr:hypothetical protein B0H14DRAFT_2771721 [Mycena olivaceomarginata]